MQESETVVGVQAYRPTPVPVEGWSLDGLVRGDATALESARLEAQELARALAAQAVAFAPDADTREYDERLATLTRTIWPSLPLEGYGLESSFGALLVARIAMNWARPAPVALRDEPGSPDEVLMHLRDLGLDARTATQIVGSYVGPPAGFQPLEDGLGAAALAGLAEGTLTRREHDLALAQVAMSPRCASRLVTTVECLARVRATLPVLPPASVDLGPGYAPALSALVLGRPERTLELLGYRPEHPALVALVELARAEWAFSRGDEVLLDEDPGLVLPPFEHVRDTVLPPPPSLEGVSEGASQEDDDVLDVVEERVHTGADAPLVPVGARPGLDQVRPPAWVTLDHGPVFDAEFLAQWKAARRANASLAARRARVLGLKIDRGPRTMPEVAVPPEPRVLVALIDREGLASDETTSNAATDRIELGEYLRVKGSAMGSAEPVFAAVRSALRAIVAATQGHTPTEAAVDLAGDLDWVIARARALALGGYGDLEAAMAATARIQGPVPPEVRFIEARRLRYDDRTPPPVSPEELRRLAHPLVIDLVQALARTVAGTLI